MNKTLIAAAVAGIVLLASNAQAQTVPEGYQLQQVLMMGEIEMVMLRFLHNGFIQFKGRHVLRRVGRNEPAVVANRYEYANFHHQPLFVS